MNKINKLFGLITLVLLIVVSVEPVIAQSPGFYHIQVGAYRNPANALYILRNSGFNPSTERYQDPYRGLLHRVIVPNIRAENVQSVRQTLERLGFHGSIIRSGPQVAAQLPAQGPQIAPQIPRQSTIEPALRITPRSAYQTIPEEWEYRAENAYHITITDYKGSSATPEIPHEIEGLTVTKIGSRAFSNRTDLINIIIPNTITNIEHEAFMGCLNLTSITLGNGVITIGAGAFAGCTSLTDVTIPNRVVSIGGGAFINCTNLTSVIIGNSVTYIGDRAFDNCAKLTSVTIGSSVTYIGARAFANCNELISVTFEGTTTGNRFSPDVQFPGNLLAVYLAAGGGSGIYTRQNKAQVWWKQ